MNEIVEGRDCRHGSRRMKHGLALVLCLAGLLLDRNVALGATVDGTVDPPLIINADLSVSDVGDGTLKIINGGTVTSGQGRIGTEALSTGVATVDGTGSTWTNSNVLYVGQGGDGTLAISNGGAASNGRGAIGETAGGTGAATVDGADSRWTNSGDLAVGFAGDGTLTIGNGGAVSNLSGQIGLDAGSTGAAKVDGTGSTWINNSALSVGPGGEGTLTISGDGTVLVGGGTGMVDLATNADAIGTLNIGAGGAAGVLDAAGVAGGDGTATLNFDHTDAAYVFTNDGTAGGTAIDITGSTAVNQIGTGTTILTGNNTYTGATTVNSGTLRVDGSVTSAVSVNAGGTLGGVGTVGNVTLNTGAFVAPGDSPGTLNGAGLTWNGGGALNVQLGATNSTTDSDLLVLTGGLTKGTVGTYTFHFSDGTGAPTLDTTYTLITFSGPTSFVPSDFAYDYSGTDPTLDGTFAIVALGGGRSALQFTSTTTPVKLQSFTVD